LRSNPIHGWWCAAVLTVQPVVFFWKTLVSKTTHIPWDLTGFHAPLVAVVVEALKRGRLPLWDPYTYAGYPLHADMQAQLFYPPAWPAFLLGVVREDAIFYWLEWLVALHLVLAGAGAYLLLRRLWCGRGAALFGATVFQLGCFFTSQPQHLGAVAGAAWMPFAWLGVVALADGFTLRRFALFSAALAMVFLAGFAAITLVAYGATLLLALGLAIQRKARMLPLIVLLGFAMAALLSAVELLPARELSANSASSQRWRWNEPEGVTPRAMIGAVLPDYLHVFTPFDRSKFTEQANFTFLYFYNGQLAAWLALLALFARKGPARIFAVLAGISLVIVCGGHLPGYALVFRALPKAVRNAAYVEFAIAAYSLSVAVAAALVLQKLLRGRERWAMAVALATGIELLLIASNRPMNSGEGGWKGHDSTRLMMRQPDLLPAVRALVHETEPPLRIDTAEWSPRFTGSAPLLRLPSANGDNPFAPLRMLAYRGLYAKVTPWERQYPIENFESPLIGAANVGFIMHNGAPLDEDRLRRAGWVPVPVKSERPLLIYRNLGVLPRYRLAQSVRPACSMGEALAVLPGVDPRSAAVVEGLTSPPPPAPGPPGRVHVLRYAPERVELLVNADRPSFLVAAEGYAPGWKAAVDGRPAAVYPADVAFMGLPVASGRHRVNLFYRPLSLYFGAAVSAIAWMLAIFWVWRMPRNAGRDNVVAYDR
jgi:hypothetical protein